LEREPEGQNKKRNKGVGGREIDIIGSRKSFPIYMSEGGGGSQEMDRNNRKLEAAIAAVCCTHHDGWAKGAE
jgi:hypothetical protein